MWQKANRSLIAASRTENEKTKEFFVSVDVEALIAAYGKIGPMFRGRPKRIPMDFLNMAAGEITVTSMYWYKSFGIAYFTPHVIGKKRKRARLTYAGLQLLDHWAERSPSFKPFVEAYVTKKARLQIASDSFDLNMGVMPPRFVKDIEKNKIIEEKIEALLNEADQIRNSNKAFHSRQANKKLTLTSSAQPVLWAQSINNQMLAQQQSGWQAQQAVPQSNTSLFGRIFGSK